MTPFDSLPKTLPIKYVICFPKIMLIKIMTIIHNWCCAKVFTPIRFPNLYRSNWDNLSHFNYKWKSENFFCRISLLETRREWLLIKSKNNRVRNMRYVLTWTTLEGNISSSKWFVSVENNKRLPQSNPHAFIDLIFQTEGLILYLIWW